MVALAQLGPDAPAEAAAAAVALRCTTGGLVPMVDFRVVDGEMRDVPRDGRAQGEIVLRASFLIRSDAGKPQASETPWAGGDLHTQDVAVVRPDGDVQIVDRLKDIIKRGGEWLPSIKLERLIADVPGIEEWRRARLDLQRQQAASDTETALCPRGQLTKRADLYAEPLACTPKPRSALAAGRCVRLAYTLTGCQDQPS